MRSMVASDFECSLAPRLREWVWQSEHRLLHAGRRRL